MAQDEVEEKEEEHEGEGEENRMMKKVERKVLPFNMDFLSTIANSTHTHFQEQSYLMRKLSSFNKVAAEAHTKKN